jgi:hypothetical protein
MSPTKLSVREAEINRRIAAAVKAGDLAELQRCAAEQTQLYRSYYGQAPRA